VGAALVGSKGAVFTGCNVENASYGLTVCAERVALLKALSEGAREFAMIVVVADTTAPTPPCGPCRQLLWEYCGDIPVVLANLTAVTGRHRLRDLLPFPFDATLLNS
jgi:cytidine deaminase